MHIVTRPRPRLEDVILQNVQLRPCHLTYIDLDTLLAFFKTSFLSYRNTQSHRQQRTSVNHLIASPSTSPAVLNHLSTVMSPKYVSSSFHIYSAALASHSQRILSTFFPQSCHNPTDISIAGVKATLRPSSQLSYHPTSISNPILRQRLSSSTASSTTTTTTATTDTLRGWRWSTIILCQRRSATTTVPPSAVLRAVPEVWPLAEASILAISAAGTAAASAPWPPPPP